MGVLSLDLQQTDAKNSESDIRRLERAIAQEEADRKVADQGLAGDITNERNARQGADTEIWREINTIEAASDVVDVVGTYADLQNYDTSKLHDNDLIKVLQDSTHDNAITYYRWSTSTEVFTYVGAEGPYYTTAETDALVSGKQDTLVAGDNIQIAADGKTISATDTTYTAGTNVSISALNVISATDTKYSAGAGLVLEGSEFAVDTSLIAELSDLPTKTSDLTNDGSDGLSTYVEADELATVATSGSYNDLTNKPTIPAAQIQSDWSQADNTSADYIKNKPTIPSPYILPIASANDLGGIKVGTNLSIDSNGVLSATDTTYSAGTNITINGTTINATDTTYGVFEEDTDGLVPGPTSAESTAGKFLKADGTWDIPATNSYTAGTGINIDANNEISADTTVLATQTDLSGKQDTLTAGNNISISGTTISATDTTYSTFTTDLNGLVPGPSAAEVSAGDKYLKADGSWATVAPGTTITHLYFHSNDLYSDSSYTNSVDYNDVYALFQNGEVIVHGYGNAGLSELMVVGLDSQTQRLRLVDTYDSVDPTIYLLGYVNTQSAKWLSSRTILQKKLTAGTNVAINSMTNTISATDTTYSDFTGATSGTAGTHGLVPAPAAGDDTKFLAGDGTWQTVQSGGANGAFYLSGYLPYSGTQTGIIAYKDRACTIPAIYDEVYNAIRNGSCAFSYGYASQGSIESETIYTVESGDYTDNTDEGDNRFVVVDAAGKRYVLYPEDEDDPGYPNLTATFAEDGTYDYAKDGDIPTVNDATLTITQNGTTAGTFSANASSAATIVLTDTTYSDFTGATSSVAGAHGLVPAPAAGDQEKVLHGDGTWKNTTAKLVEMSYGESNAWAKFLAAYNAGSIVYCRASSNADPSSGSQTRKAFMAYVNNETNPTSVEFQYVRSVSSKTDSQQGDQVFVYTLKNTSGGQWSVASRNMSAKINVSGPITKTFSTGANATVTIGANAMTGATSSAAGAAGVVPAPAAGDEGKVLTGAGTWSAVAQPPLFGYVKEGFLVGGGGPGNYIGRDASGAQGLLSAIDIKNALTQGRSVFLMGMTSGSVSSVCQVLCFAYNDPNGNGAISWTYNGNTHMAEALQDNQTWTVY